MRTYLPWLLRLLGPALLILFLTQSDLGQLAAILSGAKLWPILLSLLLLPPFLIVKSWRWLRLLREMGITSLRMSTAVGLYIVGIFLGTTTPGQAGDLIKAWYLRDRGAPLAPALLSVVLDRLFDLLVMAAFATLGIFALGQLLPSRELQTALVVAMGMGLTALAVLLIGRGPRQWLLTGPLVRLAPERLRAALAHWSEQLASLALRPRLLLEVSAASLVSAAFTFYRLWLLFDALSLERVPLYAVIGVSALIAVLQVLPISIAGLGVRDAALIAVLAPYGYSTEQAISLSALFLLINIQHILAGFVVSFWFPLGRAPASP